MNRTAALLLLLIAGGLVSSGPTCAAEISEGQASASASAAAASSGAAVADSAATKPLYDKHCKLCHGVAGVAPRGMRDKTPSLADPTWQDSQTDEQIRDSIVTGKEGTLMKSFSAKLSAEEIDAIIAYVRALRSEAAAE